MDIQNDIPKYRKKKSQESKSSKRSDHKHKYAKSIRMVYGSNGKLFNVCWSEHCDICGRRGDSDLFNDRDFKQSEYTKEPYKRILGHYLSYNDICKKFPDVPIYRNDPDDAIFGKDIRLR